MNRHLWSRLASAALFGAVGLLASLAEAPANAQGRGYWAPSDRETQAQPRLPVRQAYRAIANRFGGEPIDLLGVEPNGGGEVYLIAWLSGDGRRLMVVVDAQTGDILSARGD
jgi:uncharacterized membrane protein YkoI